MTLLGPDVFTLLLMDLISCWETYLDTWKINLRNHMTHLGSSQ
jgi:hypothetical protein